MSDERQRVLNISDISSIFSVNEETVRKWIKSGKLKASLDSKKGGYKITEDELKEFVETQKPKYRKLLPLLGLFLSPVTAVSSILGSLAGLSYSEYIDFCVQNYMRSHKKDN